MMINSIIFDGDDTLWENNLYFQKAICNIADKIQKLYTKTLSNRFKEHLRKIEYQRSRDVAYGLCEFQSSISLALVDILGRKSLDTFSYETKNIMAFFPLPPKKLYPGKCFFNSLVKKYRLYLYTKGNSLEQDKKIDSLRIRHYFEDIYLVNKKSVENLDRAISKWQLDKKKCVYVGDSVVNDIVPALALGLKTICFKHDNVWEAENNNNIQPDQTIKKLLELEKIYSGSNI